MEIRLNSQKKGWLRCSIYYCRFALCKIFCVGLLFLPVGPRVPEHVRRARRDSVGVRKTQVLEEERLR